MLLTYLAINNYLQKYIVQNDRGRSTLLNAAIKDRETVMEHVPEKRPRARTGKAFAAGSTPLQYERSVLCPYCGESFISVVDASAGDQSYYEDCEVCCRPILFHTEIDSDGNLLTITTLREDD